MEDRLEEEERRLQVNECLDWQTSRSINIVGKDDISRQGENPDR
jgi:hypothetical protein